MKYTALFSGQGSQYPGMGRELCENFAQAREVYECAGDILGFDVGKVSFDGAEDELSRTLVSQPAIFTLSLAAMRSAESELPTPSAVAGHSLGEFAALCAAGAYSTEDGFRIIKARAQAMDAVKTPGAMYAVIGGDSGEVGAACDAVEGFVKPVNFNTPNQTVISGDEDAAAKTAAALEAAGKKVARLRVSAAFHTERMSEAAEQFRSAIAGIEFRPAGIDFYSNLTGGKLVIEDYPAYFAEHMVSPVRFVEEMSAIVADGMEACVEFGPGRTVSGLAKKNARSLKTANVEDCSSLKKAAALFRKG